MGGIFRSVAMSRLFKEKFVFFNSLRSMTNPFAVAKSKSPSFKTN